MKVLITGGLGFLGGRLAQFMEARGEEYEVLIATRQKIAKPQWLTSAQLLEMDWDSPTELSRICSSVDVIIHLAGMNAKDSAADPVGALQFNAVATARLLKEAITAGVKKFIYFSTAHVYASSLVSVITEETCPSSLHPYATSHLAAENVVREAHARGVIEGTVIRLSNAYGPPAHKDVNCWTLLVNDLCRQAITNHAMILKSSGLQRRDFVSITDVCRATVHLLHRTLKDSDKIIFNVGGNWAPTVLEMAKIIQERCEQVHGFRPALTSNSPALNEKSNDLNYLTNALIENGFIPSLYNCNEIDQLLSFCKIFF